jgi:AraC-like DNA-binding protein
MQTATFSIGIVRDIVQYVAAQAVEVDRLCAAACLDPDWLKDPDRQVSGAVLRSLWREAVQQTGDRHLGLHIGEAFNLSAIGIVGYVLLNCQTFGQVLDKLCQYTRLFSQGVAIQYQVVQGWVQCDCEIVADMENYLTEEPRQPIESTFAALVTATQQLTGKPLPVQAVWFQHPSPEDCSEHHRIFQATVQFSQPINRIVFTTDCLNWPVRSANASLLAVFEDHAAAMLAAQRQSQSYAEKVMLAVSQCLPAEVPTVETIARRLMVSVRQLQRALQAEQTSYQQVLDVTRQNIALRQLQNPDVSVQDVAFLLGFSEPSAFHRAFKRWTGQTPRHYRANGLRNLDHS